MPGVRDRVAVVTGAANGLGREIALGLARAGAKVAVGDLEADGVERTAAAITTAGGDAIAVAGDLTEEGPAGLCAAVEELARRRFDYTAVRALALPFARERFAREFSAVVADVERAGAPSEGRAENRSK